MYPSLDPVTQQQIEEFHQRLAQSAAVHQQALQYLVADRMQRDWEALHQPQSARPARLWQAGHWVLDHITAHLPLLGHKEGEQEQPPVITAPFVVVIDAAADPRPV